VHLRLLTPLILVLALPGVAQAGTASSTGSTVSVSSPPGENLDVSVGFVSRPGQLAVSVLEGTLQAGTNCTQHNASMVFCTVSGVPRVVVDLGDGDDEFSLANEIDMRVEVSGGPGNDDLSGDTIAPLTAPRAVATVLDGGPGDDELTGGVATPDTLIGGDGVDEVDYGGSRMPTTITMNGVADDGGPGEGDNVAADFENITGSLYAPNTILGSDLNVPLDRYGHTQSIDGGPAGDVIDGRGGSDSIDGFDGDDTLAGAAGDDLLIGSDGHDRIDGGPGADNFVGENGDDTLLSRDGAPDERLDCDAGTDTAVVDRLLDGGPLFGTCENVDAAWIAAPRLFVRVVSVKLRRGRLRLPVECLAMPGARCKGKLTVRTARAVRFRGHRRKVSLGRAKVRLKGKGTITVRVPRAVRRRVLRRRQSVGCLVIAALRGSPRAADPLLVRATSIRR
jgi:hypothetical protein